MHFQEEATIRGASFLTLRENTKRPIPIAHGTNHLVGKSRRSPFPGRACGRLHGAFPPRHCPKIYASLSQR
jgi:hypothetical protein